MDLYSSYKDKERGRVIEGKRESKKVIDRQRRQ
jgi:hypothetical protein